MLKQSMLKYTGKLIGQIIPGVMATLIGAYLVQQIFPGKTSETPAPGPAQPTAAVMSPTPMAPASTGTIMPRRVGPPGPVPVVARERLAEPPPVRAETPPPVPAREEAAVP